MLKPVTTWPAPPYVALEVGVPIKLRAKLNPVPPEPLVLLSSACQILKTFCEPKLLACFATTAAVQLEYPVQYAGLSAFSKNGCGATFGLTLVAFVPALAAVVEQRLAEVAQPKAPSIAR